jgi:CRP-like cAMP-binding protein
MQEVPKSPAALASRPKNQLLRSLPDAEFARIYADLETVSISKKFTFYDVGQLLEYVYFPNGGVVSVTVALADGTMVEAATIGDEGMVGLEAFFGETTHATGPTMLQVPDTDAEKLSVVGFRREVARQGPFAALMGRYARATVRQVMQSAACNARHHVHERCARWLLMTHDRVRVDHFQLSHEYLAMMLGVRRQSVTVVAGALQAAGLLTYRHGHVTILDRAGLEAASCECYAIVRHELDSVAVVDQPAGP